MELLRLFLIILKKALQASIVFALVTYPDTVINVEFPQAEFAFVLERCIEILVFCCIDKLVELIACFVEVAEPANGYLAFLAVPLDGFFLFVLAYAAFCSC